MLIWKVKSESINSSYTHFLCVCDISPPMFLFSFVWQYRPHFLCPTYFANHIFLLWDNADLISCVFDILLVFLFSSVWQRSSHFSSFFTSLQHLFLYKLIFPDKSCGLCVRVCVCTFLDIIQQCGTVNAFISMSIEFCAFWNSCVILYVLS